MSNHDTQSAVYDLGRAFEAFKDANDQRLREVERRGAADPLTDIKIAGIYVCTAPHDDASIATMSHWMRTNLR
jgi:hypothetical protein